MKTKSAGIITSALVAVAAACGGSSGKQASTTTASAFVASAQTCPTHQADAWTPDDRVKIAQLSLDQSTACARWLATLETTTTTTWVASAATCPTHEVQDWTDEDRAKLQLLHGDQISACGAWTASNASTTTTQPSLVEYKVTGGNVNITYADPSDDTIQQVTVHGPWSKSWPDPGGSAFLSISVQNEVGNSGPNSCTITVGGQVVSTHSASGYNIADCKR